MKCQLFTGLNELRNGDVVNGLLENGPVIVDVTDGHFERGSVTTCPVRYLPIKQRNNNHLL